MSAAGKDRPLDIQALRLADDIFMRACFQKNKDCAALMLRIILGKPDLEVERVETQKALDKIGGRSLRLDVLATDGENRLYNIEIQLDDRGADPRRARYHLSMMDALAKDPGKYFERLPETYVIIITARDVLGHGRPLYMFERRSADGLLLDEGSHIVYVNGAMRDGLTELGRLMHDLFCPDPDAMYYELLAQVTRYFKQDAEGVEKMGSMYEEILERGERRGLEKGLTKGRTEGRLEEKRSGAARMLAMGKLSLEEIAVYAGLDLDEVRALAAGKTH